MRAVRNRSAAPQPRTIPRRLRRAEIRALDDGQGATFHVDGTRVACLYWHATGAIERETASDSQGRMHGWEREYFADGRLKYEARWTHGVQVGWQQQWGPRGKLLVRTHFVRGTGLDAWFDYGLSETRDVLHGERHGFERWWSSRTTVWQEGHFKSDLEHGILRRWTGKKLDRGYPQFWLAGEQVTRPEYERSDDNSLPPFRPQDNLPLRRAPRLIEPG